MASGMGQMGTARAVEYTAPGLGVLCPINVTTSEGVVARVRFVAAQPGQGGELVHTMEVREAHRQKSLSQLLDVAG